MLFSHKAEPTLTPLAPRLSLRSSSRPTSIHDDGSARTILSGFITHADSAEAHLDFASLLRRDPRMGISVCGSEAGLDDDMNLIALPGGDVAVTGHDAPLLVHEMHRHHTAAAQRKRRHNSLLAGVLTIVVLGLSIWFLTETVWALSEDGGHGRGMIRWLQLGCALAAVGACAAVVPWLRTRRPSAYSQLCFIAAVIATSLAFALATANLVLAFVWRRDLASRCWDIDVAWTMRTGGKVCASNDTGRAWIVAAAVRLVVTTVIGLAWLWSLQRFRHCLNIAAIIDPNLAPSVEARMLLDRHSAGFISLTSNIHRHTHGNDLPHMPDRAALYALANEGEEYESSIVIRNTSTGGVGTWLGAKVMGAFGWLLGVQPYDDGRKQADAEDDKDVEKLAESSWRATESDSMRVRAPVDMDNPLDSTQHRRLSLGSSSTSEAARYKELFADVSRSSRRASSSSSEHDSTTQQDAVSVDPRDQHSAAVDPERHAPTGSSGSSGGSLVFVRMSDGRLVRKLSTIVSEASADAARRGATNTSEATTAIASEVIIEEELPRGSVIAGEQDVGSWARRVI